MPNTAKQEAIRKAYGEYWEQLRDHVDEDGYSSMDNSNFYPNVDWNPNKHHLWRPKSLQGIENNNGWQRYEDVRPTESGLYLVIRKMTGNINYEIFSNGFSYYPENPVTHWQPIVKPEKPIY